MLCLHGFANSIHDGIEEQAGEEQEISCTHIDVANGTLEFRALCETPAGRKQPERVAVASLQQDNDEKGGHAGSSREQHRFHTDPVEEETDKQGEIAALGRKPLITGGA